MLNGVLTCLRRRRRNDKLFSENGCANGRESKGSDTPYEKQIGSEKGQDGDWREKKNELTKEEEITKE